MNNLSEIFESIKALSDKLGMSFSEIICEAFFIFDDEFQEMDNQTIADTLKKFEEDAHEELNDD
jgi:hypothetical protein